MAPQQPPAPQLLPALGCAVVLHLLQLQSCCLVGFSSFVIPKAFGRTPFCSAWYFRTRPGMSQSCFTSLLFLIGFMCTYSKNINSIYFHPHLSLPLSIKPFLPPPFYDCKHVTTSLCVVTAFQRGIADLFLTCSLHTSMQKRNSLSILIQENESYLTEKHEAFLPFSIFQIKNHLKPTSWN